MNIHNVFYLPSGRIFLATIDGSPVEFTEMRDVKTQGKINSIIRNTNDPKLIWKNIVPFNDKWLMTVSTQKGCVHSCKFCDVATLPFKGNLTKSQILQQVDYIIKATPYAKTQKAKIGFARMGEPAHNLNNVLGAIKELKTLYKQHEWLPCFNSILPKSTIEKNNGYDVIDAVLDMKERHYNGFLHFQISCNTTNEIQRKQLFNGAEVLPIKDIIQYIKKQKITTRTVTLNFIIMKGKELDIDKLLRWGLDDKFTIKLIPLNKTHNGDSNNLKTKFNYSNLDDFIVKKKQFEKNGITVVVDAIAKCEEAGLCCGQLAGEYV